MILVGDRDRRGNTVNLLRIRLLESLEKLTCVGRKTLDVTPLPFGIESVECQTRLSTSAHTAKSNQLTMRNIEIHSPKIVDSNPTQLDVLQSQSTTSQ